MPTLHWLTRDADIHAAAHVPYRLLEESPDLSTGRPRTPATCSSKATIWKHSRHCYRSTPAK